MNTARANFAKILAEELEAMEKADGKTVASDSVKEVKGTSGEGAPSGAPEGGNKPAIEKAEGSTVASTSVSPSKDLKGAQNVACESFVLPHDVLVEHGGKKVTIKGGTKVMLVKEEAEAEGEEKEEKEEKPESKPEGEKKPTPPAPPAPPFGGASEEDDVGASDLPDIGSTVDGTFGGGEEEVDPIGRLADAMDGFADASGNMADAMHEFLGVEAQEEEHGGEGIPPVEGEGEGTELSEIGAPEGVPFEEGRNKLRNRRMGRGYSINEPKK